MLSPKPNYLHNCDNFTIKFITIKTNKIKKNINKININKY